MGLLDIIANALIEEGKSEDGKTQSKAKKPVKKEVKAGPSESKEALAHKIASELAEIERKEGALGERERQIEASTREVKVLKEKAEEKPKEGEVAPVKVEAATKKEATPKKEEKEEKEEKKK